MLTYLVFRLGSLICSYLPTWIGYRLATIAGNLAYVFMPRRRANVVANLTQALGPEVPAGERRRLVRGVFHNGATNYYELLRLPRMGLDELDPRVRLNGFDQVVQAQAAGRGVILVTGHLGCFEAVPQVLAARHLPLTVPAEPVKPRRLFEFVAGLRSSHGLNYIPADFGVMRRLIRSLREGDIVGLAVDRDVRGDGVPMEFFGRVTTFQTGAAVLARRLRVPVLAAFAVRRPGNKAEVFVEPPIAIMVTDDEEHDLMVNMRTLLDVVAKYVRAYPEQWVAFEPVWPTTKEQNDVA
jgi:lauroyl/myristoyl acyltransferase